MDTNNHLLRGLLRNLTAVVILIFISFNQVIAANSQAAVSTTTVLSATTTFLEANSKSERKVKAELQNSETISASLGLINQHFKLKQSVEFVFGAEDGPLFDTELNQIWIPYFFIEDSFDYFSFANNQGKLLRKGVTIEQATDDALMHTLFHEFAHAIIYLNNIPVLGKEEDAADSFANFLLIEFFEEGAEIAINAADLFKLEGQQKGTLTEEDFQAEHSLDKQRYYAILCQVYGSDPKKYASLKNKEKFTDERAELCIDEYNIMVDNWLTLLKGSFVE
jgi:hypothetical protein